MDPVQAPSVVGKSSRPLAQNRRRGNRHQLHIQAMLMLEGDAASHIPVTITEISIAGVGLRVTQSVVMDAIYALSSFDTLVPPGMRVRVISQHAIANGEFKVGAQTI